MNSRIYLIGIMGSGKTTAGKELANKLSFPFYDLDDLIEKEINMSISEYFAEYGESEFRKVEQSCLRNTFSFENAIIATGGGAPCFFNNMDEILQNGTSFYLKADVSLLCNRLNNEKLKRPLISNLTDEQMVTNLTGLLEKRERYYSKANFTVNAANPVQEIVSIIESI